MNKEILSAALECLKTVTPLKTDCGEYCERACCMDNGEAGSCVWLLPGEDDLSPAAWAQVSDGIMPVTRQKVRAISCFKPCERAQRPFMCRIFPLSPYYSEKSGAWSVRMDRRAAAICPLFKFGKSGLAREFTQNAERAVRILASDEEYLEVLKNLEAEENAYRIKL